ncbi:MAG TPA: putative Ig domain-containing protein, partial [Candidatus Eisenbacteria bacterium]|nr:putative Ig domain-containing protein [Candidatus Eisenbacteria bacterium]
MLKRLFTTILAVVAIAGFASVADAQYMYLDSNGDGVHSAADVMNANGTPTTVDVWLRTNLNRDGSTAVCNQADGDLTMNSYVVSFAATGGNVTYSGFINRQTTFAVAFGEVNAGNNLYKNGFGQQAALPPGTYRLATITITGTGGTPAVDIVDIVAGSADFTSFGVQCSGNDFDNTYKLTGPGGGTDWTDVDGLGSAVVANTPPTLNAIGNKSGTVGSPITFTATATDADVPAQTLTFSLGAGAPAGATIGAASGNFSWTPSSAGTFPVTVIVTDSGSPPLNDSETIQITVSPAANNPPVLAAIGNRTVNEQALLSFTATATDPDAGQTLTFSLGAGAPVGAAITAGGNFTWTPTETQGPGVFPITVVVTDNGSPAQSDSETIQVTVNEVNVAPVLAAIGNRTVNEGSLLSFTATATDADIPANTLTFSLGAGAPAGAAITAGGSFTWTPTEAQSGLHNITVVVTDNGTPALNDTETIQVTVNEVNEAPVLAAIGNKTVNEGVLLSFTATATDADLPAQTLTFSLGAGAPAGAAITAGGAFTWTPSEAQSGLHSITVNVSDGAGGTDSETIQVTVNEVNQAPVLGAIGNRTVNEGVLLSFTATATDADVPTNTLTFSLGAGAPAGAAITAGGAFTWTPTEAQGPGNYPITVNVSDGAGGTDSELITVTVNEVNGAPVLDPIGNKTVNEGVLLSFTATATDADVPPQGLTFSLGAGAPAGAAIT